MKTVYLLLILLFSSGCEDEKSLTNSNNSIGSISGIITNHKTNEVIPDVLIKWRNNGILDSTRTDSTGYYMARIISPGEYLITFEKDEYVSLYHNVQTPYLYDPLTGMMIEDPNPVMLDNIELVSLNASVSGRLVSNYNILPSESPITIIATADGIYNSDLVYPKIFTTITNEYLEYSFDSLPAQDNVTFEILPYNDGNNIYQTSSSWSNNTILDLSPNSNVENNNIDLTLQTNAGITFLGSSTDINADSFTASSNIILTFSKSIDEFDVTLEDSDGLLVLSDIYISSGSTIIINPDNLLEPLETYIVTYNVKSSTTEDSTSGSFNFLTSSSTSSAPGTIINFELNENDDWKANYSTTSIDFKWDTVSDADGYRIYAKDNWNNTDYVNVGTFTHYNFVSEQSGTVYLPSQFSGFDDGQTTPFTNNTSVTFIIVAYNDIGEGEISNSIVLQDQTPPSISISAYGTADNSNGYEDEFYYINLTSNEYIDDGIEYTLVNTSLSSSNIDFNYDTDFKGGLFRITVPEGTDLTSNILNIKNIDDNSGNEADDIQIIINETGLYFNFDEGYLPSGWSFSNNFYWDITSQDSYSGSYSAGIPNNYPGSYVYMDSGSYDNDIIPYEAEVTVTFRWKFDTYTSSTAFLVNNSVKLDTYDGYSTNAWNYASYTFTNYSTNVDLRWRSSSDDVFIDDVRIEWE